MSTINFENNASYNFVAPSIAADADRMTEVFFPTSEAVSPRILGNAAIVDILREKTIIDLATLSANCTVNLKPVGNLNIGAIVAITWKSDATARAILVKQHNAVLGTFAAEASKSLTKLFIWNGDTLLPVS